MFAKPQVKPQDKPHVSSKVRAYGRARIDIAQRAVSAQDWETMWKPPQNRFPFTWGKYWKQCIEYRVDDFASEVGFFIDILGLPVIAFDPNYAMFTSPSGEFTFAVAQSMDEGTSTPPQAIRIQFMVDQIFATTEELERRGIVFVRKPEPLNEGSTMFVATFQTPHGIYLDVWGEVVSENNEAVDITADEEDEMSIEEELEEEQIQPEPVKSTHEEVEIDDLEVDDLFEEIHDEPTAKPVFDIKPRQKPETTTKEDPEEDFNDEVQYVDEPDANYPAYKPIPFGK